jgi:hypothetical protein
MALWPKLVLPIVPVLFAAAGAAVACSSRSGDPPAPYTPSPLGTGSRIKDITNPNLPNHPKSGATVSVSGVVFTWLDTYDETHNGKSEGTVYVQDVASQDPYSGLSIYAPTYIPANLRVSPGDVLDYNTGAYDELPNIDTASFPTGMFLVQLAKPVGQFDYEYSVPQPVLIDPTVLTDSSTQAGFDNGLPWTSMLVTIKDVYLGKFTDDTHGRHTAPILPNLDGGVLGVQVSNELMEIDLTTYAPNTHFASITGLVTWFYNYHIAPRTPADLVVQ